MGGKSSKQKLKISKAESGGKQAQGKIKDQKEPVENGESATEKSAQNETTSHETGDNTRKKTVAKSENATTELAEKRSGNESTGKKKKKSAQPEPVLDPIQHPSETTPADTQPASVQSSPLPEESKTDTPKEEPVKDEKPEELDKKEVVEILEEQAPQDEFQPQEIAETVAISEAEPNIAHTEEVQNTCDKKEEEEGNISAICIDTSENEVADDTAAEAEETKGQIEQTKCAGDGLEQNVILAQQDS